MSIVEKDELVPIPYIIGEFINEPYKTSDFLILLPANKQLVAIHNTDGFIHDDYCIEQDGECDEDCEDGFWRDEDDTEAWVIDFPWSLMKLSVFYSGLESINHRSIIEASPTHIWSCVEAPTKDVGETLVYRMFLPNTYEDARICMGAAHIKNDPKGSLTAIIINCINQFWQSPYNRDLTNIVDLEELLTKWENDPDNTINTFIENSKTDGKLFKIKDLCETMKIDMITPMSIFRDEFITNGNLTDILNRSLDKTKVVTDA